MTYQTYQLIILVNKTINIQIGKLGKFNFETGQYITQSINFFNINKKACFLNIV